MQPSSRKRLNLDKIRPNSERVISLSDLEAVSRLLMEPNDKYLQKYDRSMDIGKLEIIRLQMIILVRESH